MWGWLCGMVVPQLVFGALAGGTILTLFVTSLNHSHNNLVINIIIIDV